MWSDQDKNDLAIIHVKLTESLQKSFEKLQKQKSRCTCTFSDGRVIIKFDGLDANSFELEPDNSKPYFVAAKRQKLSTNIIGNIKFCYRTRATDDSFRKAKETLSKEAEQNKRQKMIALDYQRKTISSLKEERTAAGKKALKTPQNSKAPFKIASQTKSRVPMIDKVNPTPKMAKPNQGQSTNKSPVWKRLNQSEANLQTTIATSETCEISRSTNEPSDWSKLENIKDSNSSGASIRDFCANAVVKRRALEDRLFDATKVSDESERSKLIQSIRSDLHNLVDELYGNASLRQLKPVGESGQ